MTTPTREAETVALDEDERVTLPGGVLPEPFPSESILVQEPEAEDLETFSPMPTEASGAKPVRCACGVFRSVPHDHAGFKTP